jgi:phage baseplate assembly protein V
MARVTRDGVERFQNYGHTSNPHPGAEGVMVSVGGNQDHGIVIAVDDRRYRLTGLAEGETALYDDLGQKVYLTRNGIVIDGANLPINIQNTPHVTATTAKFTITGDLEVQGKASVTGAITSNGDITAFNSSATPISMSNIKTVYNGHVHVVNAAPGTSNNSIQQM